MTDVMVVGVKARDAKIVDDLVEFAKRTSPNGLIETKADWEVVKVLFTFWAKEYPEDYVMFQESIRYYRKVYSDSNKHGVAEGDRGSALQHYLEMPELLYNILKYFFPSQNLTSRKFVRKLIQELPIFKMQMYSRI